MKKWSVTKRFLRSKMLFQREEDFAETYAEVMEGSHLRGFNLWILGFAMVIACIGLNTDSLGAVIGAMLISPLMGPIVGFAFGLSLNDAALKRRGIRNWLWMTLISLAASTLFFLVSPFDNDTAALASFKKATIFDILLAFFGGMAGFIGIVKKEGTKVIAGVAVTTACMPPLCTAGFGIAHWDYAFFIGGLYFYLINCLFIGLATFLLSRLAGYHLPTDNQAPRLQVRHWLWTLFIVLMIVPGVWIAWQKWREQHAATPKKPTETERIQQLEHEVRRLDSMVRAVGQGPKVP
jgi:uncharacterized hydrophobic protein (TIGR00271 family)